MTDNPLVEDVTELIHAEGWEEVNSMPLEVIPDFQSAVFCED
jgi:hypothetical protein